MTSDWVQLLPPQPGDLVQRENERLTTQFYVPGAERGIRYNDPALGIEWPVNPRVLSEKDRDRPNFHIDD